MSDTDRVDIYFHVDFASGADATSPTSAQLDRIERILTLMAKEIDDLNAAFGKLSTDIDTAIAEAQAGSTDLHTKLDAAIKSAADALAADTVDKATITDLQAQLAAIKAAAVSVTTSLQAADAKVTAAAANLVPSVVLPPVPPPVPPAA